MFRKSDARIRRFKFRCKNRPKLTADSELAFLTRFWQESSNVRAGGR